MLLAEIDFAEVVLSILIFFLFFAWIWILVTILVDLLRDHELSGVAKAAWVIALIFLPMLGALIYLVSRGSEMRDRKIKEQEDMKRHFDERVRDQATAAAPAGELQKLAELKEKGALSAEEFDRAKAKLLS